MLLYYADVRRSCVCSHHKLLLCASHASASLCVLMCSDQQLNQSGDGTLLPQRSVVGRAQSQVTDQTNCSLREEQLRVNQAPFKMSNLHRKSDQESQPKYCFDSRMLRFFRFKKIHIVTRVW